MKKRIIALLLCVCMLVSDGAMALTANSIERTEDETLTAENTATQSVTILLEGEKSNSFYLSSDEKKVLMATADFPISSYQWQILADQGSGLWVNILDRTNMECEVSVALLESVLSSGGSTALRCMVADYQGNRVASNAVSVTVVDAMAASVQVASEMDEPVTTTEGTGAENSSEETVDYVTVTIKYLFAKGSKKEYQTAAKEYVAKVMVGQWEEFNQTINSPAVVGYMPDQTAVTIVGSEATYDETKKITIEVYYTPAEVNYTVRYFFQKIYSDEYEDGGFVVQKALTEKTLTYDDLTNSKLNTTGFYDMYFATEDVAADGSTVVECYFDRQYYLIRFDCNEGYGTDPIYARYGTTFAVNEPVRYGYTFTEWKLSNEGDFTGELLTSLKNSVPAVIDVWEKTPVYQAQWKENPDSVSYKVAYWGVSGDKKYLLGSKVVGGVTAGDKVSGQADLFESYICGHAAHQHTADCYVGHTHSTSCFPEGSIVKTTVDGDDLNAIINLEGSADKIEDGCFYIITTNNNGENFQSYWTKIRLSDEWYQFKGGKDDPSKYENLTYVSTKDYTTSSSKTWRVTKYVFQLDGCATCGKQNHVHTDDCRNTDNYLTFESADGAKKNENGEYETDADGNFVSDGTVIVAGDNSTVVNVYYKHKEYTLRFYYARSSTDTSNNTTYEVVGGSTYHFGASASNADMNSATASVSKLLGNVDSWGKVANEPKLKDSYINNSTLIEKYQLKKDTISMGEYTYYYLEFTAGFGTDISDVWPVDILESVKVAEVHKDGNHGGGTNEYEFCKYAYAYFSAWNGQYGVYYSHHNTNQTIKGAYQYLDHNLIFDKSFTGYADDTTVSYLCFWENGADIDWSIPKVFDYKLWKEYLQSDQDNNKTPSDAILKDGEMVTDERNDTTYYLFKDFNVYDNSSTSEQTAIQLDGYTLRETVRSTDDNAKIEMDGAELTYYSVQYYYDAKTDAKISFYNYNGDFATISNIPYGTPLKTGLKSKTVDDWTFFDADGNVNTPPYPSVLETGAYEFMGWYTTADCLENSKYDLASETMPSSDLMLYAKWQKKTHTVTFYGSLDNLRNDLPMDGEFNVPHGTVVGKAVGAPSGSGATFIGWFYLDDSGNKCFFSSLSTPVKSDMKIYAEWRTTDTVEYTIYYKIYTEQGTFVEDAAEPTTGTAFVNSTKTFKAAVVNGAFPLVNSHSMVIKADPTQNVYIFEYRKASTSSYTVNHVNNVTGEVLKTETVSGVSEAVVTVKYEHFENMIPDATQKTLILTTDPAKNIITFYYTYSETQAMLTLHFMKQSLPDGTGKTTYVEDEESMLDLVVTWSADNPTSTQPVQDITGFQASQYAYSEDGVRKNIEDGNTTITVDLQKDGTHIYLFYERKHVQYSVKHMIYGTDKSLEEVLNEGQTGEAEGTKEKLDYTATEYFEQTVLVLAKKVKGYTVVGNESYNLVIAADENSNVVTFYYRKNNCTIYYSPVVNGKVVEGAGLISNNYETVSTVDDICGCTAYTDKYYKFIGWYKDEACTKILTQEKSLTKENMPDLDVTDPSVTYYALFEAQKSDLIIDVSAFTAQGPVIVAMKRERTDEMFYFVVKGKEEITIKLMDVGTYFIKVAAWNHDSQLDVVNSNDGKIEVGEDERVEIHVKGSSNGNFWLYGRDNQPVGGNT